MYITDEMRKSFDKLAELAITNAQAMIRNNANIPPTLAYRLAFANALEMYFAQYFATLDLAIKAKMISDQRQKDNEL